MNELSLLLKRLGWQGGTIYQAMEAATKLGWRPHHIKVLVCKPITALEAPMWVKVTIWGSSLKEAMNAAGFQ